MCAYVAVHPENGVDAGHFGGVILVQDSSIRLRISPERVGETKNKRRLSDSVRLEVRGRLNIPQIEQWHSRTTPETETR